MATTTKKGNAPVRCDEAFKEGAIRLVNEQKCPIRQMAFELGICPDTLKTWLKKAGISPASLREDKLYQRQIENVQKGQLNIVQKRQIRKALFRTEYSAIEPSASCIPCAL